jgi:hypothetical protein
VTKQRPLGTGRTSLGADGKSNPTNITRISRAIAHYGTAQDEFCENPNVPETVEQVVFYQPGVGTETGQKIRGGKSSPLNLYGSGY